MVKRPSFLTFVLLIGMLALAACGGTQSAASTTAPTVEIPIDTPTPEVMAEAATESVDVTAEVTNAVMAASTCAKLNLNDLTEEDLMSTIPNFASRMVREFFEYRPYVSIQQFRREIGKYVDATQVAEYEQYVYVPVDPNDADADTLMQIPGVDETLATTLISNRSYADNQAFLDALAESLDAAQVVEAACYLS